MKKRILASAIFLAMAGPTIAADGDIVDVTVLGTSDIHGHFMPWDYASDKLNMRGSLSQINVGAPAAFERANYVRVVGSYEPNLL